jgi:hypothetical protein
VLAAVVVREAVDHELADRGQADDLGAVDDPHEVVGPDLVPRRPVAVVERHRVARDEVADPLAVQQLLEQLGCH